MNNNLRVAVIGAVGRGKSHVMYTIEKALREEYGETIRIDSPDLEAEKRLIGHDINEWTRPTCESIGLHEFTEGSLSKQRYRFELRESAISSRTGALLVELIRDNLKSVSVHGGQKSILVFTVEGSLPLREEIRHLLQRGAHNLYPFRTEFELEDIGLSGTLFNTKVSGKIDGIYPIGEGKDHEDEVGVLNIVLHYS